MKINRYRDRIICLFFVFFLLAALELTSRLIFPYEDRIEQILNILQQDSRLFWRQKSNLNVIFQNVGVATNSLGLRNREITLPKDKNSFRIVCLGASPTFGWGVDNNKTYSRRLDKLLNEKYNPERHIEVINAGVIGYTSYQGLLFLKDNILRLSPDLITVSYVLNDVDKHRFYRSDGRSDKELGKKNEFLVILENILDRSIFFRLLKKSIINSRGIDVKYFSRPAQGRYSEKRRVSSGDYSSNLTEIINTASTNGIKAVMIKMPINLPPEKELSPKLQSEVNSHITKALAYADKDNYDGAVFELRRALELNPYSSKVLYYLGFLHGRRGNLEEARNFLQKAKEAELLQCGRLGKVYNRIMEEVAKQKNVSLVDIVSSFDVQKKDNDTYLFLDPEGDSIHPNAIGHKIIAEEIYKTIVKNHLIN